MRIFQEEVFGPFTSVTPFKDEADALRLANDSPFGLAAAVRQLPRRPRASRRGGGQGPASSGSTIITGSTRRPPGAA